MRRSLRLAITALLTARVAGAENVRINDPSLDTPERTTQSETTLAVVGDTVCASFVDTGGGGLSGIARSQDRGTTWADLGNLPFASDPVLAAHQATGRFYQAKIAFAPGLGVTIGVFSSDDDCRTFRRFATASPAGAATTHAQDKPWIAVDNSGSPRDGSVYVCWTRFVDDNTPGGPSAGEIRFSRSLDEGVTFVDDQVISAAGDYFPFGCSIAVGPAGEVYVSWATRTVPGDVHFRRSLDGGVSWDPVVAINTLPVRPPGQDRVVQCEAGAFRPTLAGDIRMLAQTWMAVDGTGGPYGGHIYVTWADDPPGNVDNSDVWLARSTDGGTSWSDQMQIAAGGETDQFEPFAAVGGTGAVALAWYDRRNDPLANSAIDLYTAFSRDGGESFGPLTRVSDGSFPVPPLLDEPGGFNFDPGRSACYMGEYIAVAADEEFFYYAWGDNRNTLVTPLYPSGRPDPDVYFDRIAVPGICGDGRADADDACDDGNLVAADGCSRACTLEIDVNCDGRVTAADAAALASLVASSERAPCGRDDANGDAVVDAVDLAALTHGLFLERGATSTADERG